METNELPEIALIEYVDMLDLFEQAKNKWRSVINKKAHDKGTADCSFCKKFFMDDCKGCPIAEFAGVRSCHNTPYHDFIDYVLKMKGSTKEVYVFDQKSKKLATAELNFIETVEKNFIANYKQSLTDSEQVR